MSSLSFKSYESMSRAELLRRIGQHLNVAASRYYRDNPSPDAVAASARLPDPVNLVSDGLEKRILRQLTARGSATPRVLKQELKVSGMTVTRKLARLRRAGLVVVSGHTRGASYRLRTEFDQN